MKLWFIWQTANDGYDTYDSAVVAAETEDEARGTNPGASLSVWTTPNNVSVKVIGEAVEGTLPGVICASFNAG